MQLANAILVHRGVTRDGVKPTAPGLRDQDDLPGGVGTVLSDVLLQLADQGVIRQSGHRDALQGALLDGGGWSRATHGSYRTEFRGSGMTAGRANAWWATSLQRGTLSCRARPRREFWRTTSKHPPQRTKSHSEIHQYK